MADRQFLRLNDRWALAYDRLQWIIQYRTSAKGKPEKWGGVSFISSNRVILVLTLREKGIVPDPGKMEEVLALPHTHPPGDAVPRDGSRVRSSPRSCRDHRSSPPLGSKLLAR